MEQQLINLLASFDYTYTKIDNETDIELVYDMCKNNNPDIITQNINNHDAPIISYVGLYYKEQKDYENMMK